MILNWFDLPEYEGYYQINQFGTVKALTRTVLQKNGIQKRLPKRFIKWNIDSDGYATVMVCRGCIPKRVKIHRLVALGFIGISPHGKDQVNHKDGDKLNNYVGNLEWCSVKENNAHAAKIGLMCRKKKLSSEQISNIVCDGRPQSVIAKAYGVSQATISKTIKNTKINNAA